MSAAVAMSPAPRPSDITGLCELVEGITGIQLPESKHEMVAARLSRTMRRLGFTRFRDYAAHVQNTAHTADMREMLDLLTTNKTSFFREPRHFEVLADYLIDVTSTGVRPRLWSAGCSSGEEPYTMAMTALGVAAGETRILATDVSLRVLHAAREASYDKSALGEVPESLQRTAFVHGRGNTVAVEDRVRSLVSFASLNLLGHWPMRGPFHAIFCRNVMIYFGKATREALVERYRRMLVPGGLLFVGLSESLSGLDHRFTLAEPGVYFA